MHLFQTTSLKFTIYGIPQLHYNSQFTVCQCRDIYLMNTSEKLPLCLLECIYKKANKNK